MEWELGLLLYGAILLLFLFAGVWIAVCLGAVGIIGLLLVDPVLLRGVESVIWQTTNSFLLSAVPLYLLMGSFILRSGLSERLYRSITLWIRGVPGGLAHTNIAMCTIFAAVTGSSLATAGSIGPVAVAEMGKRGYDRSLTYGSLAAGGTLGILIPPSIPMILYASMVGESVGRCFMAGVIPGILLAFAFSLYIMLRAMWNPRLTPPAGGPASWKERLAGLKDILPFGALIMLVLGGIYFGVASPTEAAALGALGAVAMGIAYRQFSFRSLMESLLDAARTNAMVMFLLVGAQIVSFGMASAGIPRGIVASIGSLDVGPAIIFAALVLMYLVLGCLIDSLSMMLLTLPVVYPIIAELGFNLVWFGVVLVVLMETGLITPPVGINLFIIQGIAGEQSLAKVMWGSLPYVAILLAMVAALWWFPSLSLWLPGRMS